MLEHEKGPGAVWHRALGDVLHLRSCSCLAAVRVCRAFLLLWLRQEHYPDDCRMSTSAATDFYDPVVKVCPMGPPDEP